MSVDFVPNVYSMHNRPYDTNCGMNRTFDTSFPIPTPFLIRSNPGIDIYQPSEVIPVVDTSLCSRVVQQERLNSWYAAVERTSKSNQKVPVPIMTAAAVRRKTEASSTRPFSHG
jgi:hypothetical protein